MARADSRHWLTSAGGVALLWTGVLAGPVGWAADFTASYALVKWACGGHQIAVLRVTPLTALALCMVGAVASWSAFHHTNAVPGDAAVVADRGRFMAILGLSMSALFAFVVLVGLIPRWMLDACL